MDEKKTPVRLWTCYLTGIKSIIDYLQLKRKAKQNGLISEQGLSVRQNALRKWQHGE